MTRKTIIYKGLSIRDPAPYGEAGLAWQNNFISIADTLDSLQSSVDSTQEALGGLVIGTDIQAHSANLDTWSGVAPSADGQSLVAAVDYAAMRGLLGLEPGTDIQAHSANLDTWSSIAPSADAQALAAAADYAAIRDLLDLEVGKDVQAHSANLDTWSSVAPSANGKSLVAAADYDAMRGLLDLVVGVDIQAYSANLDTWSGVEPSADAQALVAAVDYAAMRGLLGVRPGADVQGYSAELGAIAGLTPTDGNVIVGDGSTWVAESGATARASLGLGSMATQAAGDVAITGGTITGITDLAVADGGTGASDAAGARGNLGLGSIATQAANSVAITGGAINGTAIGATTPGAGTFTTLSATGIIGTPETTSSTIGVVNIGGLLIHGFRHPTGDTARPEGNNVFIGKSAGNFTMGAEATSTAEASGNTGIGYLALNKLTTGNCNTAIGDRALLSVTEGIQNTAIGQIALVALTTGSKNVGLGYYAGRYIVAGDGYQPNQTTSNSTYIGAYTRAFADGVTNEIVIGYAATGRGSNTVQIGNSLVTDTYLSGWLNLPSDTRGIKLDAAGTTTLTSDGTTATLNKPLKTAGYQAADGSAGISKTITFKDADSVTHTLIFKDGLLTSHTTS